MKIKKIDMEDESISDEVESEANPWENWLKKLKII